MVTICQDKEDILKNRDVKLAEKDAGCLEVRLRHVVHQFKAHREARVLHLSVVVLRSPHAGINHELELRSIELQQRLEAVQVDGLEQLEELNPVFGVFVEIFVDHLEGTIEDTLHDRRDLVLHQILGQLLARNEATVEKGQGKVSYVKLVNYCGHGIQHFSLSCIGNVAIIVDEDRLEK